MFDDKRMALNFASTEMSLRLIGEGDLATVSKFQAALFSFARRRQRVVALDLSDLSFIDATGLAAIIAFERQLRDEERTLMLSHPNPMMKRVLDATGLTWLLEVQAEHHRTSKSLHPKGATPKTTNWA